MTEPSERPKRWRRRFLWLACVAALVVAGAWAVARCTGGARRAKPTVRGNAGTAQQAARRLRVMTVNLAHGRGTSFHQLLVSTESTRKNLRAVAALLRDRRVDVAALQEADGPSVWSGSFNHVAFLADAADFGFSLRGSHVNGLGLSYGTALVSRHALSDGLAVTFAPSPPTFSKGLVVATLKLAKGGVDVVSVHLDFSRHSVRESQVDEMLHHLAKRERPTIVCGDFNCDWTDERSPLKRFATRRGLHAYEPEGGATTFPSLGRRLDWILISKELVFHSYEVLARAAVSDHHPVLAEIGWR